MRKGAIVRALGSLEITPHEVRWDGNLISTTRAERDLLRELAVSTPQLISREELCIRVMGERTGPQRIDVHISRLRTKLRTTPLRIPRASGEAGYRLVIDGPR